MGGGSKELPGNTKASPSADGTKTLEEVSRRPTSAHVPPARQFLIE